MNEYKYNVLVEDAINKVFDEVVAYDMCDIYDRATFILIKTLLNFYYNSICISARYYYHLTHTRHYVSLDVKRRAKNELRDAVLDAIDTVHNVYTSFSNTDKLEFMLLCDCINEMNRVLDVNYIITFDSYDVYDDIVFTVHTTEYYSKMRTVFAFEEFNYTFIDVNNYIKQFVFNDLVYINSYDIHDFYKF